MWFWPHQGTKSQEMETQISPTYTKGWAPQQGLICRPCYPRNGCKGLDLRSSQMLAFPTQRMKSREREQMIELNKTEMKSTRGWGGRRKGGWRNWSMAYLLMKGPLIDSSLYLNPLQTAAAQRKLFILLELEHSCWPEMKRRQCWNPGSETKR